MSRPRARPPRAFGVDGVDVGSWLGARCHQLQCDTGLKQGDARHQLQCGTGLKQGGARHVSQTYLCSVAGGVLEKEAYALARPNGDGYACG